jgi:hypothetical protein
MHYNRPELDQKTYSQLQDLNTFLKAMGADGTEPIEKLVIKKEDVSAEDQKVVVLSI